MTKETSQLNSGQYWLTRLEGVLPAVVKFMALRRYGAVPDVDDRVSDALAALVEGANRFKPQSKRDGIGYFLQYTLSFVAGALRNGASTAKDWSDEATTFTDIDPEALGIERVWETHPGTSDEEPSETQFVLHTGKVATTTEIIGLVTGDEERSRIAAKILGVQVEELPVQMLRALDSVAEQMSLDPRWPEEAEPRSPVVTHELEAVMVTRNGVQTEMSAAELREAVEQASQQSAVWAPEESGVQCETDNPWPTWVKADGTRSYQSAYLDDQLMSFETEVAIQEVAGLWGRWAKNQVALGRQAQVGMVLGSQVSTLSLAWDVLEGMLHLASLLDGEADGVVRNATSELADQIVSRGVTAWVPDEITEEGNVSYFSWIVGALRKWFGVDSLGTGWQPTSASAEALQPAVARWVEKTSKRRGVWASQATALRLLVLQGASPAEARTAARNTYAAR